MTADNNTAAASQELADGVLLGCGNPLLDLQTTVEKSFLDKWGLKENDAILCDDKLVGMFEELSKEHEVDYIPGGATQNALRVCQWILNQPNKTTFFGAVGDDTYGKQLAEKASGAGVNVQYQINKEVKTGTCASLINGQHRSLCAHLAAANTFTVDHVDDEKHWAMVEKAKYYYIAGFFLTVCPPAIMKVAKHACENDKPFMFNLAAPFISQFFTEPLMAALPYVDVLFGNEDEAAAFSNAANFGTTDVKEIALKIAALPKENSARPRMVVITQGSDPVVVVENGDLKEFPIIVLPKEQIVDTNGAGDAFVGGFIAQKIQGKSLEECIKCGNYAASQIIQQQGCTFPETCEYH